MTFPAVISLDKAIFYVELIQSATVLACFIYISMPLHVGCYFNEQGSGCPDSQLPELATTTYLSASQRDHACKTCFTLVQNVPSFLEGSKDFSISGRC